jgi:hypothetical protein
MQYLMQSVNVINGLLLAAVVAVAYFMAVPFVNLDVKPQLPTVQSQAPPAADPVTPAQSPSPADYAVISNQNPFHPERRIPQERKAVPRPELFLYGTIISGDMTIAFLEDRKSPYTTTGRGKRPRMVRKGESVSGYVLQEVRADQVALVRGDDRIVVVLSDAEKRKPSAAVAPPAAAPGTATAAAPSGPGGLPPAAKNVGKAAAPTSPATASTDAGKTAVLPGGLPSTRLQRIEIQRKKAEVYRTNRLGSQ